jgi:hypothetical protein
MEVTNLAVMAMLTFFVAMGFMAFLNPKRSM